MLFRSGSGEKTRETLELTAVETLSPKEMASVRNKTLALEKSAYTRSKLVYGPTSRSKIMPPVKAASR